MATDYTEFAQLAVELISENGRLITIQKFSNSVTDADKPWKGSGSPVNVGITRDVSAVFLPPQGSDFANSSVADELLKRTEQVTLIAPTDIELEDFNVIMDNSVRWNILWVRKLKPADTVLLYAFGVKR